MPNLLNRGNYTGSVTNRVSMENVMFSSTHYVLGGYEGGLHYHENPHISFVFQGGDIEERSLQSYERKAGDIFYYEAGEAHQTIFRTQSSKNLNIELDDNFFVCNELSSNQIAESINNNLDAKFLVLKILDELHLNDADSKTSIDFLMLDLIANAKKNVLINNPEWVKELSFLLSDRWDEQITLKELSTTLGVHPVTISKNFRKYFFCTYGEFMRKLKIDRSISLIKNSKMSLTEIAFHCGFTDQSHFIKNFKFFTGFLPKDFQKL